MNQESASTSKQQIYTEIDELRSEVSNNPKIRLRAQTDIFESLDKAVEDLDRDSSDLSLRIALSKVEMARKRAAQAGSQDELLPWLPLSIALFLVIILTLVGWVMFQCKSALFSANPAWLEIMLGSALWGTIGSAADGLRELRTRLVRQELDLIRSVWYFTHPVIGAVAGSILFLIVYAGLLALTEGGSSYSPALVFAMAAVGGFGQRQVLQYFRETLANMLHIKQEPPEEAG